MPLTPTLTRIPTFTLTLTPTPTPTPTPTLTLMLTIHGQGTSEPDQVCPALDDAYRRAAGSAASVERARATAASLTPRLVAAIGDTWTRAAPGRGAPRLPTWSPYIHLLDHLMSHVCPTVPSRGGGPSAILVNAPSWRRHRAPTLASLGLALPALSLRTRDAPPSRAGGRGAGGGAAVRPGRRCRFHGVPTPRPPRFTPQLQQEVIDEAAHEVWSLYNRIDVRRPQPACIPQFLRAEHSQLQRGFSLRPEYTVHP